MSIKAAGLRVTGKGEPAEDVPKVQQRMLGAEVLDVERYPEITFRSTSVSGSSPALRVTGELTLHGRTNTLSAPVSLQIDGASITASGMFTVKQSDFGIKPVSVGGVVSVKDALTIHFQVTAAS